MKNNKPNEFIVPGEAKYPVKIGTRIASGLSGFIAGAVVASIIWLAVAYFSSVH